MSQIKLIQNPNQVPTIRQLALGDIVINYYDGKVYIKKLQGNLQTVVEIGGAAVSASYALSSSYATTASYAQNSVPPFPYTGSALITGSLGITGSLFTTDTVFLKGIINQTTPVSHVVTFDNTTGRLYITASSAFGGGGGGGSTPGGNPDTIQFNNAGVLDGSDNFKLVGGNSVYLTGSLLVSGSTFFTGSVSSLNGFTGSLFGTSSWAISASQAISSSYAFSATSASYALSSSRAVSSSYSISSSQAISASYALISTSASFAISSSRAVSSSYSISSSQAVSSSYSLTSSYTATASYVDYNNIVEYSDLSRNTIASIKNVSGVTILKGTPCYITESGVSGNLLGVFPADAGDPNFMPAGIISAQNLNDGDEGIGYIDGFINGVDTSAFNSGDEVFVAVGGGYTNIRPTGSALIQPLGYVEKVDNTNGSGLINGPGHFFEVPNITSGYTWVGNSDQVATPISTASFYVSSSISSSYALSASFSRNSLLLNNTASTVFATTGSNLFRGDQNITGSVSITGSLTVSGPNADVNLTATNIVLNAGTLRAPLLPVSSPPGGALLNTVLIDALNGTLYVTSSLPGTGGGTAGPTDRILTGSITASVADGTNPSNPNFFLIQSGSVEMLKFNTERVMVLETRTDTPTAVTGAIMYSASGDFFFGM